MLQRWSIAQRTGELRDKRRLNLSHHVLHEWFSFGGWSTNANGDLRLGGINGRNAREIDDGGFKTRDNLRL